MIEKYCLDNEKVGKGLYNFFGSHIGDGFVSVDNSGLGKQNIMFSTEVFSMNFGQELGYSNQCVKVQSVSLKWFVGWFVMPYIDI
jgi:hypothetical protein